MEPYAIIDLHCDTLTDCGYPPQPGVDTLNDPRKMLSLDALPQTTHWAQFFAIFIPDGRRGQEAIAFFDRYAAQFQRQTAKYCDKIAPCRTWNDVSDAWAQNKTAGILAVENGSALAGQLSRIPVLAQAGVRALTVTWNGENELGSGSATDHGLSPFGREAIPELERAGILLDVSHLNDAGLEDLLKLAKRPFLATHSNARSVCNHKRNLTDEQIQELVRRGCLIGLNYCMSFLREGGEGAGLEDLLRHIEHFFRLGAEKCLALGSDYDGTDVPQELRRAENAPRLLDYFLAHGLTQEQAEGILYRNAQNFLQKNLREVLP